MNIRFVYYEGVGYRGIDRTISYKLFKHIKNKKVRYKLQMDELKIFELITFGENEFDQLFNEILPLYFNIKEEIKQCELIIYNETELNDFLISKYSLSFLGIDLINGFGESALIEKQDFEIEQFLNQNLLLQTIEQSERVLPNIKIHSVDNDIIPQYVYLCNR